MFDVNAPRDITMFFGGGASSKPGYYVRWVLFQNRSSLPQGTVLVASTTANHSKLSPVEDLPPCGKSAAPLRDVMSNPACVGQHDPTLMSRA